MLSKVEWSRKTSGFCFAELTKSSVSEWDFEKMLLISFPWHLTHCRVIFILVITSWLFESAPKSSTFFICPFANWIRLPVNKCIQIFERKIKKPTLFEVSRITTGCCWKHILCWGKSYRLSLVGRVCHRLGVCRDGWGGAGGGGRGSSLEGGQFVRGTRKTFSVTRFSYRIIRRQGVPWKGSCKLSIVNFYSFFYWTDNIILPWWSSSFNSLSFMKDCLFSLKSKVCPIKYNVYYQKIVSFNLIPLPPEDRSMYLIKMTSDVACSQ